MYRAQESSLFEIEKCNGDIPMPRTGHGVAVYGRYMFLFGGQDFAEEAVYNDLYIFDTETLGWHYVGEAGVEVRARNSHSMTVLKRGEFSYLVLFGGASPEHGPMNDTIFAELPPVEQVGKSSCSLKILHIADVNCIFVTWQQLNTDAFPPPSPREMHGSCSYSNTLLVSGGRNESGVLKDVWQLSPTPASSPEPFQWQRRSDLTLTAPRCAHVATVQEVAAGNAPLMTLFGGFSGGDVAGDAVAARVAEAAAETTAEWKSLLLDRAIEGRFGHCACSVSSAFLSSILSNCKYSSIFGDAAKAALTSALSVDATVFRATDGSGRCQVASLMFGGVSKDKDFNDLWLFFAAV